MHQTRRKALTSRLTRLALGALLALAGCSKSTDPAPSPAIAVQVIHVATKMIPDELVAAGSIDAVDKAELGFLVAGRVLSVDVEDGSTVKKDQVLARLDPSDFQQTAAIADAKLTEIQTRHERLSKLHELGSLTATDFEKSVSALHQAESAAELAHRQLAYTELRAPFDGIAVRHGIAPGVVAVPAVPLFTVLAPSPVWVNISIAEADARRVHPSQNVHVITTSPHNEEYTGTIEIVLPQADPLSRSFIARVRLANANGVLRPGNVVTVRIETEGTHTAVTLPPQAVQKLPDGALFVWAVDAQRGIAMRRVVETGPLRATEIEINSGLYPGDQVVLNVPLTLFEGSPLKVTP